MLLNYQWPGNVRELRNVLNRLSFLYPGSVITENQVYEATGEMFSYIDLPEYRSADAPIPPPTRGLKEKSEPVSAPRPSSESRETTLAPTSASEDYSITSQEKLLILAALEKTGYNMTKTAQLLSIGRSTLYSRIRKYGISIDKGVK